MSNDTVYMLDTNVFGHIQAGRIPVAALAGKAILVTQLQGAELANTQDEDLRYILLNILEEVKPDTKPSAFALDVEHAGFDQGVWSENVDLAEKMYNRLKFLDQNIRPIKWRSGLSEETEKKKKQAAWIDVLIAEAAYRHGATFITGDKNLHQVCCEERISCEKSEIIFRL